MFSHAQFRNRWYAPVLSGIGGFHMKYFTSLSVYVLPLRQETNSNGEQFLPDSSFVDSRCCKFDNNYRNFSGP